MKYSIIIPVYNVEAYLAECLDSVLNQSFADYEVIIVNDGSTDSSLMICEAYQDVYSDKTVRIIDQPNQGLLRARRRGFQESAGEYVWSIDSDDVVPLDALETIERYCSSGEYDMAFFDYSFSPDFAPKAKRFSDHDRYFEESDKLALLEGYCQGLMFPLVTKVIRRECINPDYGYEEYPRLSNSEDQLQDLDVLELVRNAVYIARPLYYYRQNPASITGRFDEGHTADHALVSGITCERVSRWAVQYGCPNLLRTYCQSYLANMFFNVRKSLSKRDYRRQLEVISESETFARSYPCIDELRIDQRLFYRLVQGRRYRLAYIVCKLSGYMARARDKACSHT